jgi:GTP-binding protein Era
VENELSELEETFCGYVALLGRPNVGKSTLLNHLLHQKISITSRKPQTTRQNMLGVDTQGRYQAIYMDTPGIHRNTEKALNRYMVANATAALRDVDLRVMLIEAGKWTDEDAHVLEMLRHADAVNIAVISKVDLLDNKNLLLPEIERINAFGVFSEIIPLSALRNEGVEHFREQVFSRLPPGPHLFSADEITDQTERRLVEEIVREKLMRQLGDEIPHSAAVVVERFVSTEKITEIHADIYVERDGQKAIVIGKQGARLKLIGQEARKDIERMLDSKVMLHLFVKVKKGWTNNNKLMNRLGYQ